MIAINTSLATREGTKPMRRVDCGGLCMIKVKEVLRPYSENFIAWRIQAAVPNNAGGAWAKKDRWGQPVSFTRKYLVAQSTDYEKYPTRAQIAEFCVRLRQWRKFDRFEFLS